jgi:Ca2+-binding RTX toxin-like protein
MAVRRGVSAIGGPQGGSPTPGRTMPTNGNDVIPGTVGDDVIDALAGNDSVSGLAGNDSLSGSAGDDTLDGGPGNDTLRGGADNDRLIGAGGNDLLDGGPGTADFADFSIGAAPQGISLDLVTGLSFGGAFHGNDTLSGIERVTGSSSNDTLLGSNLADLFDGFSGNDLIDGRGGADVLNGGIGADTIDGGAGTDSLNGGSGLDILLGGSENDTIDGGNDDDQLGGDGGDDSLLGGSGNDTLFGGSGNDTLDGGVGTFDAADYSLAGTAISVSLLTGAATQGGEQDSLIGIERLIATDLSDTIGGSGLNEVLEGRDGGDRIDAGLGNDTLLGEGGDDTMFGAGGNDLINGGGGFNVIGFLLGGASVDLALGVSSGEGNDTLISIQGVFGSSGDDTLRGSDVANLLRGSTGNDSLSGLDGADTLLGGLGNDTLDGGAGDDTLDAGDPVDPLAPAGLDRLTGGAGNDRLSGRGSATLFAFGAAHGVDTITDYTPIAGDRIHYAAIPASAVGTVALDLDADGLADDARIVTDAGTIVLLNTVADQLLLSTGAGGVVNGGAGADLILTLSAAGFSHDLRGGGGADTIVYGADTQSGVVDGGSGDDLLINASGQGRLAYAGVTSQVVVDLVNQISNGPETGFDRILGFRSLQTGSGNDIVVGSAAFNFVQTGGGDDWVDAGDGGDTLDGQGGADTLLGGPGNDSITGGTGLDYLSGGAGIDIYRSTDTSGVVADLASGFVNSLTGQPLDFVEPNFETYQFSDGNDIVVGWTQNLTVDLGAGADWFADFSPGHNDVVFGDALSSGVFGDDTLQGLAGDDSLAGRGGADQLYGGDGADTLIGGDGADYLSGAAGVDRFVFEATSDSPLAAPDVIADFQTGVDRIDLSPIDANGAAVGLGTFAFVINFTGVAGQLRIRSFAGFSVVEGDTNGDQVADIVITVIGSTPSASDLIL